MAAKIKKIYVVDASFVLAFLLPDERAQKVDSFFDDYANGKIQLVSLPLLHYEVLNGLRSAVLSKRLFPKRALDLAQAYFELKIRLENVNFLSVLKNAFRFNLSVYDASYLVLSSQKHFGLLSMDEKLKK